MDGDTVNLRAMLDDLHEDDILLVDEAHALGLFGHEGAGFAYALKDSRVVVLGTLSKAIGAEADLLPARQRSSACSSIPRARLFSIQRCLRR